MNWRIPSILNWRIKGAIQKVLSVLPYGQQLNDLLQSGFGGRGNIASHVEAKVVQDWLVFVAHFRELGRPIAGAELLEIGSGWLPILPICFSLAGAKRCYTYDVTRHMDERMTRVMLTALEKHLPAISAATGRAESEVRAAYRDIAAGESIAEVLRRARIEYCAPADAAVSGLDVQSVDVVFSNSVLEHVRDCDLDRLMIEAKRILKIGGVAIHSVNCGDHYAYFDRAITPINYLKYSSAQWRKWNNDLLYQNRLRPDDFLASASRAGLSITMSKFRPRYELLERLPECDIAPEFRHYSREQLCATSIDFVAQRD